MDSDESEEIFTRRGHSRRKKRRENIMKYKIKQIFSPINKSIINHFAKILTTLILLLLIIYIVQFILLFNQNNNMTKEKKNLKIENKNNKLNLEQKLNEDKNISLDEKIEKFVNSIGKLEDKEIFQFRKMNSQNILFDRTKHERNNTPDISVILTINNQAHCAHKALRSIQNQSLKNIEIIVAIDCSIDNSTETILSYMKEDERITMINNDIKQGTMKNRIDGIRKAKGKYITVVDGDDALIQKDILKNALHIANLGNLDIVEFEGNMYGKNQLKAVVHHHIVNGIIRQPQLRTKFFSISEKYDQWRPIVCRTIWGKLIKNEVLQKTIETIGPEYSDDYILVFEDAIIMVTLYQIAQSYYLFKQPGYYYSRDEFYHKNPPVPNRKCLERQNVIRGVDSLKFINYLYDRMEDNEIERQTLYHEIISINYYNFSKFSLKINDHYDMLYRVLDKLDTSKYLTEKEKEKLKKIKDEVVNKEKSKK